jgi:outer membrane immunogenic protein
MRSLIASVAAATIVALTGGANAADLGGQPSYTSFKDEVPYVRPFSWTGGYIGLQLGYAWSNVDARDNILGVIPPSVSYGYDVDGFIGGGHVGWNWQKDTVVFGLEADIEYTDLNDNSIGAVHRTDVNWMGSVRGRLGFAADRTLIYMTGGWAFADVDVRNTAVPVAYGDIRNGWTLGAGAEYAFADNLTGRLEYRYTDFGQDSARIVGVGRDRSNLDMHAIRTGLSLKF